MQLCRIILSYLILYNNEPVWPVWCGSARSAVRPVVGPEHLDLFSVNQLPASGCGRGLITPSAPRLASGPILFPASRLCCDWTVLAAESSAAPPSAGSSRCSPDSLGPGKCWLARRLQHGRPTPGHLTLWDWSRLQVRRRRLRPCYYDNSYSQTDRQSVSQSDRQTNRQTGVFTCWWRAEDTGSGTGWWLLLWPWLLWRWTQRWTITGSCSISEHTHTHTHTHTDQSVMWPDEFNELPAEVCSETLAESKCPSGLVDWAFVDFTYMYCDVFATIMPSLEWRQTARLYIRTRL